MAGSSSARVSSTPASAASWSNRASIVASYPPVCAVDREHAAGIPDAEDLLAGELLVHVAGQGRQVGQPTDVFLAVQDRLVEVRDAPPVRDVAAELRAEPLGRPARVRVAPGAERREQRTVGVERQVAVHHRRHTEGADRGQLDPVASPHVVGQGREALLQPCPDGVQRVRPHPVHELVLPVVAADGERSVIRTDQHRLDPGRPELDPQGRATAGDRCAGIHRHVRSAARHAGADRCDDGQAADSILLTERDDGVRCRPGDC